MAGMHRERIELLERRFDTIEEGMARIPKIERILERMQQGSPKKRKTDSSAEESADSNGSLLDI